MATYKAYAQRDRNGIVTAWYITAGDSKARAVETFHVSQFDPRSNEREMNRAKYRVQQFNQGFCKPEAN